MTTPNKATPEQWEKVGSWAGAVLDPYADCLLELRSRIEALEAAANSKPTPNPSQIRSSPAGELMQVVSAAICPIDGRGGTPINWEPEARAAILAVARWLGHRNPGALRWAALLREEVEAAG